MDCRTFHKKLEDYLQGGLDFPGRFGMERHAMQCFACGKDVADAQKLGEMARRLHRVAAPPDFEARVLARVREEASRDRFWNFKRFWIYGFELPSARLLFVGASVLILSGLGALYSLRWTAGGVPPPYTAPISGEPFSVSSAIKDTAPAEEPSTLTSMADAEAENVSPPLVFHDLENDYPDQENWVINNGEEALDSESEYVEFLIPGPDDRRLVVRLPKVIRMQYGPPSEEHFIRNVSH